MPVKQRLWGCAIIVSWLLTLSPAMAQQPDSEKIERLEPQTELLQKQLKALQQELKETKKKTEKVEAVQAVYAATPSPATPGSYETKTSYEPKTAETKPLPSLAGVRVTLGGYVAAESVYRTHNQVADMGDAFNSIPYPFSPLFGEDEFHASARGTRLSILAEGQIDRRITLRRTMRATSWVWGKTRTTLRPTVGRRGCGTPT